MTKIRTRYHLWCLNDDKKPLEKISVIVMSQVNQNDKSTRTVVEHHLLNSIDGMIIMENVKFKKEITVYDYMTSEFGRFENYVDNLYGSKIDKKELSLINKIKDSTNKRLYELIFEEVEFTINRNTMILFIGALNSVSIKQLEKYFKQQNIDIEKDLGLLCQQVNNKYLHELGFKPIGD